METYALTNNKPSEVDAKETILRVHLLPEFRDCRLDQIGAAEVEAYKAKKLQAELAPKTINNQLTVLRKMLSTAAEWGVLRSVPPIKWLRTPPPDFDFLTFDEAKSLVAGADDDWRAMILVALRTGLRLGELRALRWQDVDLHTGRIAVTAMLYAINPVDVIPNALPIVGTLDDLAVVAVAVRLLRSELIRYCAFKGYAREEYFRA